MSTTLRNCAMVGIIAAADAGDVSLSLSLSLSGDAFASHHLVAVYGTLVLPARLLGPSLDSSAATSDYIGDSSTPLGSIYQRIHRYDSHGWMCYL